MNMDASTVSHSLESLVIAPCLVDTCVARERHATTARDRSLNGLGIGHALDVAIDVAHQPIQLVRNLDDDKRAALARGGQQVQFGRMEGESPDQEHGQRQGEDQRRQSTKAGNKFQ